jgi:RHS repeat-associated protein
MVLVVQENHYYPFGLGMKGLDWTLTPTKENKYQYNGGVEKNTDFDLGLYETDYRLYDPQIGKFVQVDPKAEFGGQEVLTTYQYGFNNPIRYNDPKGDCPPGVNCGDWLLGAVAAFVDNAMGGITPVRGIVANYISDKSGASFNRGQDVGDVASMVVGVLVTGGGVAGGAAFAPVTVGSSAVGGAMVARAGVTTALAGASNLTNQKGRVNATKKPNDHPNIEVDPANQINRDLLDPPSKKGNAPTFKSDGKKVEIHHQGQNPEGPFIEMHPEDHRGKGNDLLNHPNKSKPSSIERQNFDQKRKEYWIEQFFPKDTE